MTRSNPKTADTEEVYLYPGDFHFSRGSVRIHTLLGSCVAITLWHPELHAGGMCHFVLPERSGKGGDDPDGRYGDETMNMFLRKIARLNTRPGEYRAKLFGGGSMFGDSADKKSSAVAQRNVEAGKALLRRNGFCIESGDVGGNGYRRVVFDLRDGSAWVRYKNFGMNAA